LAETPQGDQEQAVRELYDAVASELAGGRSPQQLITELTQQNWPEPAAREFVLHVRQALDAERQSPAARAELVQQAQSQMQAGMTWLAGGAIGRLAVFLMDPTNVISLFAYAAMIYGTVQFLTGFVTWLPHRDVVIPDRPSSPARSPRR